MRHYGPKDAQDTRDEMTDGSRRRGEQEEAESVAEYRVRIHLKGGGGHFFRGTKS